MSSCVELKINLIKKTMNLEVEFKKETGQSAYDLVNLKYNEYYVEWLEERAEQLLINGVCSTFAMEFVEYVSKEHYVLKNQIGKLHYWKNENSAKITEQLLKAFEESKK